MKAITVGLAAALAFSAVSVQAASPFTFTITAESGSGVLTPTYGITNYSFFDGGEKLNMQSTLRDVIYTYGNERHVYHWADVTYDRQGGYRDTTYFSVYGADAAHAPDYIYFKATATVTPGADLSTPMTVRASSYVSGTYSTVKDPRFPNLNLYPGSATVATADSHNAADLTNTSHGYPWFSADNTFSVSHYGNDKVIPAGGSIDLGVLFYLPAQLHATSYSFNLTGLYDVGMHHFSERNYLGYEVQAVPEPTTWAMLLAGVGILGVARRRKTAA